MEAAQAIITFNGALLPICYGPEYVSGKLMAWAEKRKIRLEYIQSDKLQQNAYIEGSNRTIRGEWLGQYSFETIEEAQD